MRKIHAWDKEVKMSNRSKLLIGLYILTCLLIFIRVGVQAGISVAGYELSETQDEITTWKVRNSELNAELLTLKSLGYINNKARSMGMVDAKYYYIKP